LKILSRALRVTIVVVAVLVLLWWFGMRMPGGTQTILFFVPKLRYRYERENDHVNPANE
jgi:hypothetical protein